MEIKTKKKNSDGIVRLETSGKIAEVFVREDLMNVKNSKIAICFRGKDSSGIVEMTRDEFFGVYKDVVKKANLDKETKIIKFNK